VSAQPAAAPTQQFASVRFVVRTVLIIVGVVLSLYLLYLIRKPIFWIVIAAFVAVAVSGPVNILSRRMKRGFAIAIVYIGMLLIPAAITAIVVPPIVTEARNLANNAPRYANDVQDFVNKNKTLKKLNHDYKITDKLKQEAAKLPSKAGDAASILADVGSSIVSSLFAVITILILSIFLVGSGRRWIDKFLEYQAPDRAERLERALDNIAAAVGSYVLGALLQALIAALLAFALLSILGVPFAAPLAVVVFIADLIPLVGATIGAVLVGIVTLFVDFPTATIVWAIFSIVYQQLENSIIQPQIQRRALNVHPFVVLVAVLIGGTLLGIVGALLAIPAAAAVQIVVREYWDYRKAMQRTGAVMDPESGSSPPGPPDDPGTPGPPEAPAKA
jgi:predicted PurR-regulated permease PerM